ncbi:MAG TPA: glycoside hydrolase family 65 protein, partial [Phycisphaerae bacterium]|nr:glycoside hydrolase family 65 protein [Phycisphaerae bacterium]
MTSSWSIVESPFRSAAAMAYEGLFTLGSGYLHVRGSLEEHLSDAPQNVEYTRPPADVTSERFPEAKAKWGTYVPGIFGDHPLLGREMVNLPFLLGLVPVVDGERLDVERGVIEEYRRELSLDSATLRRALRWRTHAGTVVHVTFERFVSGTRPQMCLQRMTLRAERDTHVVVHAGLDADVRTNGYDHFTAVELSPANANGIDCRVRTDGGDEVRLMTRVSARAASWRYEPTAWMATLITGLSISADRELVVEKRTAVVTSRDRQPVEPATLLADAERRSFQELHAEHADHWRRRWESCDVVIEGDERSQLAMRASLYHLLRCHVTGDARVAIDPKGYSGDAYWGRYLWDTEMFLLPFYLYTDPARARTLADFRVNTLDGARPNAARYGYPGARYAWESDDQGRECCPNRIYADNEVHVTADVVYGLAHYARAVSDPEYLRGPAAQLIVETARYWMKRLDQRPGKDHPSLLGV